MDRIQLRRDSSARWAEINPILLEGEVGYEIDTKLRKIGDGVNRWNDLEYLKAEGISQETGNSQNITMSQDAITRELDELGSEVGELNGRDISILSLGTLQKIEYPIKKGSIINYISSSIAIHVLSNSNKEDIVTLNKFYDLPYTVTEDVHYIKCYSSTSEEVLYHVVGELELIKEDIEKKHEDIQNEVDGIHIEIGENKKAIESNKTDIHGGEIAADLTEVKSPGFLNNTDGIVSSNSAWVHGVIPIPESVSKLIFNNLPSAEYSRVVVNYFISKDGSPIKDKTISGDRILGAGIVEFDIPLDAKGFMLNANTTDVVNYNITFCKIGIIDKIDNIEKEVEELQNVVNESIIVCPDILYAIEGKELNVYYDSIVKGMDKGLDSPWGLYIDIQCPSLQNASNQVAVRKERMWQIKGEKLTASYVGEHQVQITAYNSRGIQIERKNVKLKVVSESQLSSVKNVLCIGDSLTNNGPIVATCAEHFSNIGGEQPKFVGQRTTSGFKHEGYPGYTFGSFVTSGSANAYFIFDIPEGTSVSVGDTYSTNGSTYKVTDIRTEGQDNALRLRCTRIGSTMPNSTGILTKVSGASSSQSSINYTAFEAETGNPFWDSDTSSVNFTKYREKMGMGTDKFDVVVIMLGTNDCIGNIKESMQSSVDNAKILVNAILSDAADYPTKIVLQITPADANTISSWQVYSDIMGDGRKIGYWTNLWNLRNLLYEEFTKEEWNGKVFLGQAALGLDRYYGYPYTEVESSTRISIIKEAYHTNSVHPNTEGYKQLGDGYYLQIKSLL